MLLAVALEPLLSRAAKNWRSVIKGEGSFATIVKAKGIMDGNYHP